MNLNAVVRGQIGAVNPDLLATVQVSTGYTTAADGTQTPAYATPVAFTASITGQVMTVSAVAAGVLMVGQTIAGVGVTAGTTIQKQLSGPAGGAGTYQVTNTPDAGSEAMSSTLILQAQIQPLEYRDLMQIDGLNLQGTRRKIYFYGQIDAIVRPTKQGGDLVTTPDGNVWLVALVSEQWQNWCAVIATLQNGA